MKHRLILPSILLVVLLINGIIISNGQSPPPNCKTLATQSSKRKIKIAPIGYILLPEGYKAYSTKSWADAWYGYIESPNSDFKINVSVGLVQSPFETDRDKVVLMKNKYGSNGSLKIGLKRTQEGEVLMASSGRANFTALVAHESEQDIFMEIVCSYRQEKCNGCGVLLPAPQSK